ncbi:MAG TPA: C39 family peptidase [Acidobacteriaceae bacterium]|nr:C39 family peptidase [Acidobacteriaceae bacterium]
MLLFASSWMTAEKAQAPAKATSSAVWIDVPFAAQTKDGCGSASIAMVMQYWDKQQRHAVTPDAEPEHIQAALFSPAAGGIYASRMQQYFVQSGYRAFAFSGRWSDLDHQLALGRPLIVGLRASGAMGPLHYVVVVGIDPQRNYLFMNDPAQQKMLRISREGFESEWRATHNWMLLAVPQTAH